MLCLHDTLIYRVSGHFEKNTPIFSASEKIFSGNMSLYVCVKTCHIQVANMNIWTIMSVPELLGTGPTKLLALLVFSKERKVQIVSYSWLWQFTPKPSEMAYLGFKCGEECTANHHVNCCDWGNSLKVQTQYAWTCIISSSYTHIYVCITHSFIKCLSFQSTWPHPFFRQHTTVIWRELLTDIASECV